MKNDGLSPQNLGVQDSESDWPAGSHWHWQARALFKFVQAPWARSETLSKQLTTPQSVDIWARSNHVLLNNAVTSSNKLYEGTYGTYWYGTAV